MKILEAVNHTYPNTIKRLALTQEALPNGIAFGPVFVELFPNATLPRYDAVSNLLAVYDAAVAKAASDTDAEKRRLDALAAKWPDPFALLDDILAKGIVTVKNERDAIKAAHPKPVKG
jgi:hypothetical protein